MKRILLILVVLGLCVLLGLAAGDFLQRKPRSIAELKEKFREPLFVASSYRTKAVDPRTQRLAEIQFYGVAPASETFDPERTLVVFCRSYEVHATVKTYFEDHASTGEKKRFATFLEPRYAIAHMNPDGSLDRVEYADLPWLRIYHDFEPGHPATDKPGTESK